MVEFLFTTKMFQMLALCQEDKLDFGNNSASYALPWQRMAISFLFGESDDITYFTQKNTIMYIHYALSGQFCCFPHPNTMHVDIVNVVVDLYAKLLTVLPICMA